MGDRQIWNEDFPNVPNWLCIKWKIEDDDWFDFNTWTLKNYYKKIDFKTGVLHREIEVVDAKGRETKICSKRTASMHERNKAAMIYSLQPLNWAGKVTFKTGINGKITNTGVDRYNSLNQNHLTPIDQGLRDDIA